MKVTQSIFVVAGTSSATTKLFTQQNKQLNQQFNNLNPFERARVFNYHQDDPGDDDTHVAITNIGAAAAFVKLDTNPYAHINPYAQPVATPNDEKVMPGKTITLPRNSGTYPVLSYVSEGPDITALAIATGTMPETAAMAEARAIAYAQLRG